MRLPSLFFCLFLPFTCSVFSEDAPTADAPINPELRSAKIDGNGPGWREFKEEDFTKVNCDPETFQWKPDGTIYCTGLPIGVLRTKREYKNFELVIEWRHLKDAGNSGIFAWTTPESIKKLESGEGRLPAGIEVQMLDHGYAVNYEKQHGKKGEWFSTNGDIFAANGSKLTPFPPLSPSGERSFPRKNLSKGSPEWNHYYVRGINGEIRLWVNGEEVSGGKDAIPAQGYLCLESEGSPIEFRNFRIRELP